jgi:hypothetical protein
MARAQPNDTREVGGSDGRVEFALDVGSQTIGLPRWETGLQTCARRGGVPPGDVDSEQRRRAPDASPCHPRVGVQRDSCGSQKARQCVVEIEPVAHPDVFVIDKHAWCDVGR